MTIVSLADIQRDPDGVLRRVEGGETIRIMRGAVPVAEITPILPKHANGASTRPFGLCAGEFSVPADFDAPLPERTLREFEGGG
jgi:antitoxin (DNA-binding transcriptional repressor) of toxin-antitoxin stability system